MNVSRYTDTTELRFDVEFVTPCFLGGADGNAEIRTAPFKNLLRRWWRIANGNLPPEDLWKKEAELFGSTEKNPETGKTFGKSRVNLSLLSVVPCEPGCYSSGSIDIGKSGYIGLSKYLGYGSFGEKKYVAPKTKCQFLMAYPKKYERELLSALFAIHLFGTIGSRSRNGWGSLAVPKIAFKPENHFPPVLSYEKLIDESINYPKAIGKDTNGILCWTSDELFQNWQDAFEFIGDIYLQLVTDLKKDDKDYKTKWRNLLGFAEKDERLPSQLLLKVCKVPVKTAQGIVTYKFRGQFLIIPYIADNWKAKYGDVNEALKFIIDWLDATEGLKGNFGRKITGAAK